MIMQVYGWKKSICWRKKWKQKETVAHLIGRNLVIAFSVGKSQSFLHIVECVKNYLYSWLNTMQTEAF